MWRQKFAGMEYNRTYSLHFLVGAYLTAITGNPISLLRLVPRNIIKSVSILATTIVLAVKIVLVVIVDERDSYLYSVTAFIFFFPFRL
jgi:hypothetical protein